MTVLNAILDAAAGAEIFLRSGSVVGVAGETITVRGINLRPHEMAYIETRSGGRLVGECSGTPGRNAYLAMLDRGTVSIGDRVVGSGHGVSAPTGRSLLGRVLDGLGRPIDEGVPVHGLRWRPVHGEPPAALDRTPISDAIPTGVRAIDGFLTLGRGQRVGIFAGSGVGKSTLLGMLARGTAADVTVIALIGERGREVRDFIEHDLGIDALRTCVVVTSTGDTPAAMRLCAAHTATAIAEAFRDEGLDVLLLFDSLTRVAMAQREIGLAAGEPPASRGYPPSVFSLLPHLMERAGPSAAGSITAIYTVLVEGEDMDEPIADVTRATLDGHIVLRRSLANAGHYPPIDVLGSVSRLMSRVASTGHRDSVRTLRNLLAAREEARDLISIGAYVQGSDATVDRAVALAPALDRFLRQDAYDSTPYPDTIEALATLVGTRMDDEGSFDELLSGPAQAAGQLP